MEASELIAGRAVLPQLGQRARVGLTEVVLQKMKQDHRFIKRRANPGMG
jgi:hypothetical protein